MLTPLSASVKNKAVSRWTRGYGGNKKRDCQDSLIFKRVKNINNRLITKPFSPDFERLSRRELLHHRAYFLRYGGCYYSICLRKLQAIVQVLVWSEIHLLPLKIKKRPFCPLHWGYSIKTHRIDDMPHRLIEFLALQAYENENAK